MIAELIGALIASIFGSWTMIGKKTPLFYKIIFFSVITCLMGNIYTVLYHAFWPKEMYGFHVGYLGSIGMFFFLYSSYYGAINTLADDGQPTFRKYRIIAGFAAAAFFVGSVTMMVFFQKEIWMCIVVIPMGCTLYFAMKLLIIPDVDMGIIKVMRPYNALIVALCVFMIVRILSEVGSAAETAASIGSGLLISLCLPVARNGVRKWFI